MGNQTWKIRLIAFGAAIASLGLAFALATGMPFIVMMIGLMLMVGAPLVVFSLGWLGVWLLALGGLWGGSMMLFFFNSSGRIGSMMDFALMWLVLAGLSGLGIAIVPPHVAAKHRAAWPFRYLAPRETSALKSKRDRLLMEEEIVYDVVEDYWEDDDEAEHVLPLAKRKSSMR